MVCWKVNNIECSITKWKEEEPDSGLNQELLENVKRSVFNQKNNDNFEEFTLMFFSVIRN